MSVIKEMFAGYAQRIRMENSLQLQKAKLVRPPQIKLEITEILIRIDDQLQDPRYKTVFDGITINVPE